MDDVNLYVEVSTAQVRKCRRRYMYIIEYMDGDETASAAKYSGLGENVSMARAVMTAVSRGAGRIGNPCELRIFTPCDGILAPLKNGGYARWERNGFLTSKGEPVSNADLWVQLEKALGRHLWSEEGVGHPYRNLMRYELEKMAEKDRGKAGNA